MNARRRRIVGVLLMLTGVVALAVGLMWEVDALAWRFLPTMVWMWGVLLIAVGLLLAAPKVLATIVEAALHFWSV